MNTSENGPRQGEQQVRYKLDDHLGSVTIELDEEAGLLTYEEYFPYGGTALMWGKSRLDSALKEYRYSGKERDDTTGLYYYGARYYATWLGRWLSPDPEWTVDGLNLYAFVGGNPINDVDPHGTAKGKKKTGAKSSPGAPKSIKKYVEEKVGIHSSKLRINRRVQRARGGTRNIAVLKMVKKDDDGREVLYLVARSLGMGKRQITIEGEPRKTKEGNPVARSHSESVLKFALTVDKVASGGKIFDLSGYKIKWLSSTNRACKKKKGQQNCAGEVVTNILPEGANRNL